MRWIFVPQGVFRTNGIGKRSHSSSEPPWHRGRDFFKCLVVTRYTDRARPKKHGERISKAEIDYKQSFGLGNPPDEKKAKAALDLALDIRKFEIGLYWQRAAYFWTLIAAAFAGYFAILNGDKRPERDDLAFVVNCIGLVFTWAWYLVNRGSKFWQENW